MLIKPVKRETVQNSPSAMKKEVLIVVINITVILLVLLLVMAAQSFPYFTASILGIVTGVFLYMLTEQWMTHDAVEFENRYIIVSSCNIS